MPNDTVCNFPGIPADQENLTARVRNKDTLAVLETFDLSDDALTYYTGDVTGSHSGQLLFEILLNGVLMESRVRTIQDTVGPFTISSELEPMTSGDLTTLLAAIQSKADAIKDQTELIQAKTDLIGAITWVSSSGLIDSNGVMNIKAGDRHEFTLTSTVEDAVPDLTGVTIRFGIKNTSGDQLLEVTAVDILSATGFQSVKVTILPAESILLPSGGAFFDFQAEYAADDHRTFLTGSTVTTTDYSGVP